jgi:hypothetical protein
MKKLLLAALLCAGCGDNECDKATLAGVCNYGAVGGECVEFSGLSTGDSKAANTACVARGGTWAAGAGACATAGEIGVCNVPPNASGSDTSCSPKGVIKAHFFAPAFDLPLAEKFCSSTPGTTFTPG